VVSRVAGAVALVVVTVFAAAKALHLDVGTGLEIVGGGHGDTREPRFLKALGKDAPSYTEFARMGGAADPHTRRSQKLPLHIKNVMVCIDRTKVLTLSMPNKLRGYVEDQLRWLHDPTRYDEERTYIGRHPQTSNIRLSPKDCDELVRAGKLKYAYPPEHGLGGARAFSVVEIEKSRRRPIWEPFYNDCMRRVPTVHFRTLGDRRRIIAKYKYSAQFDFASYYDQLAMNPEVQAYLGGFTKNGHWLQPQTLPMGFRASCAVAQAITWAH